MSERTIYEVTVPDADRSTEQVYIDDTPAAYRVVVFDEPNRPVCIVHGFYGCPRLSGWRANASSRWLVRHLLRQLSEIRRLCEAEMADETQGPSETLAKMWGHVERLTDRVRIDTPHEPA